MVDGTVKPIPTENLKLQEKNMIRLEIRKGSVILNLTIFDPSKSLKRKSSPL